jgi:hypothetical protein
MDEWMDHLLLGSAGTSLLAIFMAGKRERVINMAQLV